MNKILIIDDTINSEDVAPVFGELHFSRVSGKTSGNDFFMSWVVPSGDELNEIWYGEINSEFNLFLIKGPKLAEIETKIRSKFKVFAKDESGIPDEYAKFIKQVEDENLADTLKIDGTILETQITLGVHEINGVVRKPGTLQDNLQSAAEEAIEKIKDVDSLKPMIKDLHMCAARGYNHLFLDYLYKIVVYSDLEKVELGLSKDFYNKVILASLSMQFPQYVPYFKSKLNGKSGTVTWAAWACSIVRVYYMGKDSASKEFKETFDTLAQVVERFWSVAPQLKELAESGKLDQFEKEFEKLEVVQKKDNILQPINAGIHHSIYNLMPYLNSAVITPEIFNAAWPTISRNTMQVKLVGTFSELRAWWDEE